MPPPRLNRIVNWGHRMESSRYRVESVAEAVQAVDELMTAGLRKVDILSPELDPALYDRLEVVDAVRQLAVTGGRRAEVRILVRDGGEISRRGHRLATLAQQLTSAMEIRRLADEHADDDTAFLIVDGRAVIRWDAGSGYAALVEPEGRATARRLQRSFTERWDRGEPDIELRRLNL